MAKTMQFVYDGKISENDILINKDGVYPSTFIEKTNHGSENMLIYGDNLQVLKTLAFDQKYDDLKGKIKLIYIDPPFATNNTFKSSEGAEAYSDKLDKVELVEFIRRRLIVAKQLLADDGSIYVHLDENVSHYVKVVMDEIFGANCFQREIIWRMGWLSGYKTAAKNWIRNHDVILYYTKKPKGAIFNKEYIPYAKDYTRRDGSAPKGKGIAIEDTWNCSEADKLDSIQLMSFSSEKTGYPTQKNISLLERIIKSATNEGDYVMDFFAGSGTTAVAANNLKRRFIVCDFGRLSISKMKERFLKNKIDFDYYISNNFSINEIKKYDDNGYEEFIKRIYGFKRGKYEFNKLIKAMVFDNYIYYQKDSDIQVDEELLKLISETVDFSLINIIAPNENIDLFITAEDNFTLKYGAKTFRIFPLWLNENKYMDIEPDNEGDTAVTIMNSISISKNVECKFEIENGVIKNIEISDGRGIEGLALVIFKTSDKIIKTLFSNEIEEEIKIPKDIDLVLLIDKLGNETEIKIKQA